MQIILLHSRFTRLHAITLGFKHILLLSFFLTISVISAVILLFYLVLHYAAAHHETTPIIRDMLASLTQAEKNRQNQYLKTNLATMATQLGKMQAQLMRLDALAERVQDLAGVRPEEFNFKELPGQGGAEILNNSPNDELGISELQNILETMAMDMEQRADYMHVVETNLINHKTQSRLLPTKQPVNVRYNSSSFGWRLDPFTGHRAFHEGLDFPASSGTPILASAPGIVIKAGYHAQFGNMVEIEHDNHIVTRYAHASRLCVKVGDIVKSGQHIANIGSTGRSTGPHLHFEVLVHGVAQDPRRFLASNPVASPLLETTSIVFAHQNTGAGRQKNDPVSED